MSELTLRQLSEMSGVSSSHLGHIERGERFPSAHILRKIAQPLGLTEGELFTVAGYLSPQSQTRAEADKIFQNPYPKVLIDEASGIEVTDVRHQIWQEGYETGRRRRALPGETGALE